MYIRIVTLSLTVAAEDYLALAAQAAPAFRTWTGLDAKYWIADPEANRYGGVYLFRSRESADASRATELFQGMAANPAFADLSLTEFAVLDGPTEITAPPFPAPVTHHGPHPLARVAGVS